MRLRGRRRTRVEQRDHVVSRELLPHDGAALEDRALPRAEPVEAGGEQRLDRLRQRALREAALQSEREELLEEERVALRRLDDPRSLVRLQSRPAETFEQCIRLLRGQGVEQDAIGVGPSFEERRPVFEELLARKADDCDRTRPLVHEVLDELEEGRLRPVDVVEDEDKRPLTRARFAELAEEPGQLGRRRRRLGVERGEDRVALRALCRLLESLAERPVRDAVPVGEAATPERRDTLRTPRELGGQPRLADARRTDDDGGSDRLVVDGSLQHLAESCKLALAADERRVRPTLEGCR